MPALPLFLEEPESKPLRFVDFKPGQHAFGYDRFRRRRGFIYVLGCQGFHKIGMTRRPDVEARRSDLQLGNPFPLTIAGYRSVPLAGMAYGEAYLHALFDDRRMHGEWFAVGWEEIEAALPSAVLRARAFDRHCGDWSDQEIVRAMNREASLKA